MELANSSEIARKFVEDAWDKANMAVLRELLAPDFIDSGSVVGRLAGARDYLRSAEAVFQAFADLRVVCDHIFAFSDRVVICWTANGTHTGEFVGLEPTGREVSFRGVDIIRVHDGKIVERWGESDFSAVVRRLASVSTTPDIGEARTTLGHDTRSSD